jgi:hypothetical protein
MIFVVKPSDCKLSFEPREVDEGDRVILRLKDTLGQLWEIQTKVEGKYLTRPLLGAPKPAPDISLLDRG